jgi:arabinosaccharide transport system substrate-binding protein
MGIPKSCVDPDKAWKLLEHLYFSREGTEARRAESNILPPVKSYWDDAFYHEPDEFFGGQKANEVLVEMAHRIPPRYVTPATSLANANLTFVLAKAVDYVEQHGATGLEEQCRTWLKAAAEDLQKRMDHWRFDDEPEAT